MATQLFKFVTPRDPKVASGVTSSTMVTLSSMTIEPSYQGTVFQRLTHVFDSPQPNAKDQVTAISDELQAFETKAEFLIDLDAFNARFKPFADFFESAKKRLQAAVKVDPKDTASVVSVFNNARQLFNGQTGNPNWLTPEEQFALVDNLLYQMLSVAQPTMISKISAVIKVFKMLDFVRVSTTLVEAQTALKMLTLPIGVPSNFKVPPVPRPARVAPDTSAQEAAITAKLNAYNRVVNAYNDVLAQVERLAQRGVAEDGALTAVAPAEGHLQRRFSDLPYNAVDRSKLAPATVTELTRLGIGQEVGLPAMVDILRRDGAKAYSDLFTHAQFDRDILLVGATPMPVDDLDKWTTNVIWNEEETGGVIVGAGNGCLRFPFKIANLRLVEQELLGYEPGHIAHIQNTLQGEFNEKTTRRLLRTEESFSSSFEREVTDERDTQTTDRFSLERETSKVVQENTEMYVNGELSASYGPVSISIGAGYSSSSSIEESNAEASSYAKEVVQRSLNRIIEKSREERSVKTTTEFEEINRHGLDNRGGSDHVVGVYRWLDQLHKVTIKTYDTRMMIELMIPQPAKYHLSNFTENPDLEVSVPEPIHPRDLVVPNNSSGGTTVGIKSHKDINEFNYPALAAAYGAGVDPYPQMFKAITHSVVDAGTKTSSSVSSKESKDLIIPDGYRAHEIKSTFSCDNGGSWANHIFMGGNWVPNTGVLGGPAPINFEGTVNVVTVRWNSSNIGISLHVTCKLTEAAFEAWQIKTYKAIIGAYENKKAAYDNAVAEAKANAGIRIRGTNPLYNKQLIRTELKKQALYLMSHCKFIDNVKVYDDGTVKSCCEAFDKGQVIKFVDSAFEWGNMMYSLYDYFYAKKEEWSLLYNISDPDPLMNNFLKAGEARVIIPVAKGKELAVINFLTLGKPWINDLLAMEIMDVADEFIEEEPIDEIVIYDEDPLNPDLKPLVTPTTLTILECSSGGITPDKYLIKGTPCIGTMTPVITEAAHHEE